MAYQIVIQIFFQKKLYPNKNLVIQMKLFRCVLGTELDAADISRHTQGHLMVRKGSLYHQSLWYGYCCWSVSYLNRMLEHIMQRRSFSPQATQDHLEKGKEHPLPLQKLFE
jgi:hypothetical protein